MGFLLSLTRHFRVDACLVYIKEEEDRGSRNSLYLSHRPLSSWIVPRKPFLKQDSALFDDAPYARQLLHHVFGEKKYRKRVIRGVGCSPDELLCRAYRRERKAREPRYGQGGTEVCTWAPYRIWLAVAGGEGSLPWRNWRIYLHSYFQRSCSACDIPTQGVPLFTGVERSTIFL